MLKGPVSPASTPILPLPPGKSFHCFLTHNWAGDNHEKVSKINQALQRRGLITWFDEQRMNGQIRDQMTDGIRGSCCFVVFMTEIYEAKVNSGSMTDNCYFEFNYASNSNMANYRIAAAMEPKMLDPRRLEEGRFKAELGGLLFIDMTKMNDPVMFEQQVNVLFAEIHRLVNKFTSAVAVAPPALPIPPAVMNPPPLPSAVHGKSSVTTPLECLDSVMAKKLLISLGCPENFEQQLSEEVKRHLNGKYLKHIASPEELKEECNLTTLRLPLIRGIFSDLQSYQVNGIPAEIMNQLQQHQDEVEPSISLLSSIFTALKSRFWGSEESTAQSQQQRSSETLTPVATITTTIAQTSITGEKGMKEEKIRSVPSVPPVPSTNPTITREYQYQGSITNIPKAFSVCGLKDGRVAIGTSDGKIILQSIKDENSSEGVSLTLNDPIIITAHKFYIQVLTQLSDGRLVSGSNDKSIKIWNLTTLTCVLTLLGHEDSVLSLCELADGRLVSGSLDKSIKIWNLHSGNCEKTLLGHSSSVTTVTRLSDSHYTMIASASADHTIRIWNIATGDCITIIEKAGAQVIQLSDGRLASNTRYSDPKVKIWNYHSGNCELIIDHGESAYCLLQLSDGRLVSGSDSFIKIWNIQNNTSGCLQTLSHEGKGATPGLIEMNDHRIVSVWWKYGKDSIINIWK